MRTEHNYRKLEQDNLVWKPKVDGLTHDVPTTIISHPDALLNGTTQFCFYGGVGEEDRLTRRGVRAFAELDLPATGVIVAFHHLESTPANLERIARELPVFVAQTLNEKVGNTSTMPVDIGGSSQGGGIAISTAKYAPEQFRIVAALSPVGFNSKALGGTDKERRKEFLKRILLQNGVVHPMAILEIGKRAFLDLTHGTDGRPFRRPSRLREKLNYALSVDLTKSAKGERSSLKELADTNPVIICAAIGDPVFRLDEYENTLGSVGLKHLIQKVPGNHCNFASKASCKQLYNLATTIKKVRAQLET